MNFSLKNIILILLLIFSYGSSAQNIEEKINQLRDVVETLTKDGNEDLFFSIINPMLRHPKNREEKLVANYFMGNYYISKENNDSIIHYANKVFDLSKNRIDSLSYEMQAKAYFLLSSGYSDKGLRDISKSHALKGIELHEKKLALNNKNLYGLLRQLASDYSYEKDFKKALELYRKCIDLNLNPERLHVTYLGMGVLSGRNEKLKESIEYFNKAYKICKENDNYRCQIYCLTNLGASYQKLEDIDKALINYQKARELAEKYDYENLANRIVMNINIGIIYHEKKMFEKEYPIFLEALELSIKYGDTDRQKKILEHLKEISEEQGNYKDALEFESKRLSLIDSIHQVQKNEEINELEIKYQTLEKEKEINFLRIEQANKTLDLKNQKEAFKTLELQKELEVKKKENQILTLQNASEKRRNEVELLKKDQLLKESELNKERSLKKIMLAAFLIILIPSIGLILVYYQKLTAQSQLNKKQEEITRERISKLMVDQELQVIKASIEGQDNERERIAQELHDSIGGNLAALKLQFSSISNGKKVFKTINKQIDDTYNQVRAISHNLVPKKFKQNPFMSVIRDYMKNIGDASNLKIICNAFPIDEINDINEELQLEIFKILQELITNTVKHANASEVDIQINNIEDSINILFEDNGVGFNTHNRSDGIGIKNIESRIESFGGTLNIDSRKNRGTIINIEIPINKVLDNDYPQN